MRPITIFSLLAVAPLLAHHGFESVYDTSKPIMLHGVVVKMQWTNPHTFINLDVKDSTGKIVNWWLDGYSPNVLSRLGWKRDLTIKPGDQVTVTGWQDRHGPGRGVARAVTFADGTKRTFGPLPGTVSKDGNLTNVVP